MCEFVRYTRLPICATPCDDIDDMCADFADEANCKVFENWSTTLLTLIFIATVASLVVVIGAKIAHKKYRGRVHITPA